MRPRNSVVAVLVIAGAVGTLAPAGSDLRAPRVEFNRDIRPILSDNCFQCHGPDQAKRKADLRLDSEVRQKI